MQNFKHFILGVVFALATAAGLAGAAVYNGFNPATGLDGVRGVLVDNSADVPVIAQTGQTISGQLGAANSGQWVATGATTGAGTLTFLDAAPNGRTCIFMDATTPADKLTQSTATNGKTVVTVAGTIVSGDTLLYHCFAY